MTASTLAILRRLSILRRMGSLWAPLGLRLRAGLLARPRRLALEDLDDALLADLGLSRGELAAALRSGREPRRGY